MGMPADHFPADSFDDIIHRKESFLLCDDRLKHDVHQNIAEFLTEILRISRLVKPVHSPEDFVHFILKTFTERIMMTEVIPSRYSSTNICGFFEIRSFTISTRILSAEIISRRLTCVLMDS